VRTDLGDEPVPIGWELQGPDAQSVFGYTLLDLERLLHLSVEAAPLTDAVTGMVKPEVQIAKQRGARGRYYALLRQLDALERLRGGWHRGTRGRALWLQAAAMVSVRKMCRKIGDSELQPSEMQRVSEMNNAALFERVLAIAERCQPGEGFDPADAARVACRQATSEGGLGTARTGGKPVSQRTVSEWLDVTPEETELLRDHGFPNPLPAALRFGEVSVAARDTRAAAATARRTHLRLLEEERVRAGAPWPGLRQYAEMLRELGHDVSAPTVGSDLKALGISNPCAPMDVRRSQGAVARGDSLPFSGA
jgi:hypothetical protein